MKQLVITKDFKEEEVRLNNALNIIKIPSNPLGKYAVIGCRGWVEQGRYIENLHRHLDPVGDVIASKGYYWGASDYGSGGYPIKKAVKCIKSLIGYMKENYNIEKFVILGTSMGGHIALILAIEHPEDVCRVVDIYGVTDVKEKVKYVLKMLILLPLALLIFKELKMLRSAFHFLSDVKREFGGNPAVLKFTEEYDKYSPLNRISELKAPLLVIHGDKDYVVPLKFSEKLVEKLKNSGKESLLYKFHVVEGTGHDEETVIRSMDVIFSFLYFV